MAYTNTTPWHSLGTKLLPNQPIEVWQREAGLDFLIKESPVLFNTVNGNTSLSTIKANYDNKVLYRSDSHEALSVVSSRYQVVQPQEIMDFYRELIAVGKFEMETAGVLKSGRKIWALARTGQETLLRGGDRVKNYLLLATSCDGSLATTATFTSVRVVCNNTLQVALNNSSGQVKVPHRTTFDPIAVKEELGLGITAWDRFQVKMNELTRRPVTKFEATSYFLQVLGDPERPINEQPNQRAIENVQRLFHGQGMGSTLLSAKDTAFGLLNAVTEHVDHHRRARSKDYRLDSAWFGIGAAIKERAWHKALELTD